MKKCARCGTTENVTKHHQLPRRFFKGEGNITWLCRTPCHDEIEKQITQAEYLVKGKYGRTRLSEDRYYEILNQFLA